MQVCNISLLTCLDYLVPLSQLSCRPDVHDSLIGCTFSYDIEYYSSVASHERGKPCGSNRADAVATTMHTNKQEPNSTSLTTQLGLISHYTYLGEGVVVTVGSARQIN